MVPLAALVVAVGTAVGIVHPSTEHLATMETPGPAPRPVAKGLSTAIAKPVAKPVTHSTVMHPVPRCPAPDRGFNPLYARAAHKHAAGAPARFSCNIHAQAERESNQRPDARSPAGALGLMQFLPATAKDFHIDPLVPAEAVDGAARYLRWLAKRFPHVAPEELPRFVWAAYNFGVGRVRRTGCSTWACLEPFLPTETRVYVKGIEVMARNGSWYREARR